MSVPALSLLLVHALRGGHVLAARPVGVAHLYSGDLTPTGKFVPAGNPVTCKAKTGRLNVLTEGLTALGPDRRMCRRCMATSLAMHPGPDLANDRVAEHAYYSALTAGDFGNAANLCATVEESHQVARIAARVLGPGAPDETRLADHGLWKRLDAHMNHRRNELRARELTPEERAEIEAEKAAWHAKSELIEQNRAKEVSRAKANDRRLAGGYLMPHERPTG